mgnify:CR=1 FL=1
MSLEDRNILIVETARDNPNLTHQQIAESFSLTRQSVTTILNKYGYKKFKVIHRCTVCKIQIDRKASRCRSCYLESKKYTIKCAFCGDIYVYYGAVATTKRHYDKKRKTENRFCSMKCSGSYLGRNFGNGSK